MLLAACALVCAFMPTHAQSATQTMYVKVDSSNPDAVVQSSTDFFEAEPLGKLIVNQPVEMLDETNGEFVKIRCKIEGKDIEGWVKKLILGEAPLESMRRVSDQDVPDDSTTLDSGIFSIEHRMSSESAEMKAGLGQVDRLEKFLNRRLGGDPDEPDPSRMSRKIREFHNARNLQPGSMK
ncbi:MAG: SH3 domain-containing protein [Planctomycetes bacterium]|nr:SH3 domain-containing protein [Planctomycetota bacterium]